VLIFYRGDFCPFCNRYLHALHESSDRFRELGARIVAVSSDRPELEQQTVQRHQLSFPVDSDPDRQVIDAYDVIYAERGLGPGVFIFLLHKAGDAPQGILLALNEVYDPADKRTEEAVLPILQKVPREFLSRHTDVLVGPFDVRGRIERARLFRQLAAEVLALAEAEMS
jgi:thiol-disulfide isomerase/thioredoxin